MREYKYTEPKRFPSNCWYRHKCPNAGDDFCCNEHCEKLMQTDYLFQLSNMPQECWNHFQLSTEYLSNDTEHLMLQIMDDILYFIESGCDLYLFGETGCGKTSWAIKLMQHYFDEITPITSSNKFEGKGLFVSVSKLLTDYGLHISYPTNEFNDLLKAIQTYDVVIWDDIAQTSMTAREARFLFSYVNERCLAKKCNIYTSNVSPEIFETIDKRLASRCCCGAECVEITGVDMRFKNKYTERIK